VEGKGRAFQDLSDEEIQGLVESLNSLHEGELGVAIVVACGERAIPLLRQFLLHGKPSGIFVPRQRALRALAELGAKDVLLEYLVFERHIADPVVAHGEEGVRNTAARALLCGVAYRRRVRRPLEGFAQQAFAGLGRDTWRV
jgi:hypothetical protein